jgi:hypothetical protein
MPKCTKCNLEKDADQFTKSKTKTGLAYRCKGCDKIYRDSHKKEIKDYQFRCKYGISLKDYISKTEAQGDLCAICNNPCSSGRKLAVDHCHKTMKVRSLLCINCNQGLGSFKDNKELLMKAKEYLEKHD